jgi:hypothetical protein
MDQENGMNKVEVKRVNGKWAIIVNGQMVEGGFFSKDAAIRASKEYQS